VTGNDALSGRGATTSVDKALEVCEVLSTSPEGLSLTEVARQLKQPRPTVHRLLAVLKRRGYVRQDEQTQHYALTLRMLDLSFRLLGRSELRLHAYPVLREYVVRSGRRAFIAIPSGGEVTYVWRTGPDEVQMWTAYGKEMPAHCSVYFSALHSTRRLSCLRLAQASDIVRPAELTRRYGAQSENERAQRLCCTCAPVRDYTGREVARVGLFAHGADDGPGPEPSREAWDLAGRISLRLGHLAPERIGVSA
jgi:DNA-binding IclR family transcriptional regulator